MSSQSIRMMRAGNRVNRPAFTLVELLVVIGIIALLISILLPSLQMARRTAQRTACAAKLHQMMIAAQMHRQDHADYYPLAGVLPAADPAGLGDPYMRKYVFYVGSTSSSASAASTATPALCPITYALLSEMAGGKYLNTPGGLLNPGDYNQDTANFLDYAAEPVKAKRQSLGVYVIAYLLVFFVLAVLLKKEYWKDVH